MHGPAAGAHELASAAAVGAFTSQRVAMPKAVAAIEHVGPDIDTAVRVHLEPLVANVRQSQCAAHRLEWLSERVVWREGVLVVRDQQKRVGKCRIGRRDRPNAAVAPRRPHGDRGPLVNTRGHTRRSRRRRLMRKERGDTGQRRGVEHPLPIDRMARRVPQRLPPCGAGRPSPGQRG
eukprot:7234677-Prymnesium_polylepis.2